LQKQKVNKMLHHQTAKSKYSLSFLLISILFFSFSCKQEDTMKTDRDFSWLQTDSSVALLNHEKIVWQYNYKKLGKPYFDPLSTVDGISLVWKSPPDHAWHHALWFSWKEINGLNYWEETKETGLAKGLTEVVKVSPALEKDFSAQIAMDLTYHPPQEPPVLYEKRILKVSIPDHQGNYHIDWKSIFTAGDEEVVLERTPIEGQEGGRRWGGYATLACRIDTKSLSDIKFLDSEGRVDLDIHTIPTPWVDVSGKVAEDTNRSVGLTIFDHAENPRHPPSGYVIKDWVDKYKLLFAYMNPGFLYREGLTLDAGESFTLRYRIFIHEGSGGQAQLEREYKKYLKATSRQ
jgi:hypothetical protein